MARTIRRYWNAAALLPAVLTGGCAPAQIVNALVPNDYDLISDRPYGELARLKLDIYRPQIAGPLPVAVFFYGGNWQQGAKEDYAFVGQALASRGFIVVIPDYRLYPTVRYPAFLEDGALAVTWTLHHAIEIGGDPARVSVVGHSAGAYIAAMLALDGRWLGDARRQLHRFVGLAGPYDFLPLTDPDLKIIFAPEPDSARTQPITFADGSGPPTLLLSGTADTTVRPDNSKRLVERIRARGGTAEDRYYEGVGHIRIVGAIAAPFRFLAPTLDDIAAFLSR